jgi:hypothetical protein
MLGACRRLFEEITVTVDEEELEVQARIEASIVELLGADRADELQATGAATALDELLDDVASRA